MNFMDDIQKELSKTKTLTENGAVAYKSSGKALLDFLFAVTALRKETDEEIKNEFSRVFFEDPMIAMKFLFWLRDCRGGNGERKIFRACLMWLAEFRPEIVKKVMYLVEDYGRWDDLWPLLDTNLRDNVISLVRGQLVADEEDCKHELPVSLLAKWLPSLNTSSRETRRYAEIIRSGLELTPREYRITLSALRGQGLDIVERKMSSNRWSSIHYPSVPSKANLIYKNAFMRHDEIRREAYLNDLATGKTKINAKVLNPNEIVCSYFRGYDETLEQLWKNLPDMTINDTLVVRDGSASMGWRASSGSDTPIHVATAMAIYMADHNQGIWKDKFITFSRTPKFVDLSNCKTLQDKIEVCYREDECSNTNIYRTMMLLLDTAMNYGSKLPENICIISDMQFDKLCNDEGITSTLFESIARQYERCGYKLPRIIFWNVAGQVHKTIPMQENEMGVVLCSGFSVQLLKMVMSGKTDPYEVVLETLNSPRYAAVENAVKGVI